MAYDRHVADTCRSSMSPRCSRRTATRPRWPRRIDDACRRVGFFRITGHGVPPAQLAALDRLARRFFAEPDDVKAEIAMAHGGAAWRGWFPLDGELTSGRPDHKEGHLLRHRAAAPTTRPCAAGRPLHGANLFPAVRARAAPGGARLDRRDDRPRARPCCGRSPSGSACRPTGSSATSPPTRPCCSASSATRPSPTGDGVGRRRAHRLRAADDPRHRRPRRAAGPRRPTGGSTCRPTPTCSSSTSATCSTG